MQRIELVKCEVDIKRLEGELRAHRRTLFQQPGCWQSARRCARSSPSQRLRVKIAFHKLDALHLVVPAIMACALVVSSKRLASRYLIFESRLTRFCMT